MALVPSLQAGSKFGCLSFSGDSKYLFCCCGQIIKVFNTTNGECLHDLQGHTKVVTGVFLNPRNNLQILSCGLDGLLIYWDYLDGVKLKVQELHLPLHGIVTISAEKKYLLMLAQISVHSNTVGIMMWKKSKDVEKYEKPKVLIDHCNPDSNSVSYGCMKEYVAAAEGNKLLIHSMRNGTTRTIVDQDKYNKHQQVLCVACHPTEYYIATGIENGRILLWHNFCKDTQPVQTTLHWHALPVMCLDFSPDGSVLLSGGHECVFVRWQMGDRNQRDFKPRMGAPLKDVLSSPDGTMYATRHADNVIQLLDINMKIMQVYRGLTRTVFGSYEHPDPIPVGLVYDPRSRAIITNGLPGHVQFYSLTLNKQLFNLDIVGQNYISPESMDKPKVITEVTSLAVNSSGDWLATFEVWDDGVFTPEMKLKFWIYTTESQTYSLNTTVEHPHDKRILNLLFQPTSDKADQRPPTLVTLGEDCSFKIWTLIDDSDIYRKNTRWDCDSVGFYRGLPTFCADFSFDGTVLAVGFQHLITLWDPENVVVRTTLSNNLGAKEDVLQLKFGSHQHQHYLVALTTKTLISWDLLTLSAVWKIGAQGHILVKDPASDLMAFVANWGTLCVFRPDKFETIYKHDGLSGKAVVGAVFVPDGRHDKICDIGWPGRSQIYVYNVGQELISLDLPEKPVKNTEVVPLSQNLPPSALASIMAERVVRDPEETPSETKKGKSRNDDLSSLPTLLPLNEPVSRFSDKFLGRLLEKRRHKKSSESTSSDFKLLNLNGSNSDDTSSSDSESDMETDDMKPSQTKTVADGERASLDRNADQNLVEDMNSLLKQPSDWVKWCSSLSLK